METNFTNLSWPEQMQYAAAIIGIVALLPVVYHFIRLITIRNLVRRYEYVSANEIRAFKAAAVMLAIGVAMVVNSFISPLFVTSFTITAGLFLSAIVGVVFGYAVFAYFNVYYPFILEKRLSKIRFTTRINPANGNKMRLLNEKEEDVHLTPEMLKHERKFAYDYDVWIDDETGFRLIERYDGHLHVLLCEECNFQTLKDYYDEIIQKPTEQEKGMLLKHYMCSNCGHKEYQQVSIAPLQAEEDLRQMQTA